MNVSIGLIVSMHAKFYSLSQTRDLIPTSGQVTSSPRSKEKQKKDDLGHQILV